MTDTATETNMPTETDTATETNTPTETEDCPNPDEEPTTETATPIESAADQTRLDATIKDQGHYAWFALGQGHWARQHSPYDMQEGCSRWLAQPTENGGIRCFVKRIDVGGLFPQSAGFDIHLGRLGDIEEIRIPHQVIQSGKLSTEFAIGLYLDEDENGEFFIWEDPVDGREAFGGTLGGDEEAFQTMTAGEPVVIDSETNFRMVNRASAEATLGELQIGDIRYYSDNNERDTGENRGIDGDTNAALYVGLVDDGYDQGIEVIVQNVIVVEA